MKFSYYLSQNLSKNESAYIDILDSLNERRYSVNEIFELLLPIFTPVIKRYLRLFFAKGEDSDDLYQQGLIGLFNAIKSYDFKKGGDFYFHAKRCIRLSILNLVRENNAKKRLINYEAISFDSLATFKLKKTYSDKICSSFSQKNINPEEKVISQETAEEIHQKIYISLSVLEHKVLLMYLNGYSYKEIATKLNTGEKTIDNALVRVRKKMKDIKASINNSDFPFPIQ